MTIACVVHWYESLLFLAPVVLTLGAIWVTSRIEDRRELREAAAASGPPTSPGTGDVRAMTRA